MGKVAPEPKPVEFTEELVGEIEALSAAVKRLQSGRLRSDAIITLLQAQTRMSKTQINNVLAAIQSMPKVWLKP